MFAISISKDGYLNWYQEILNSINLQGVYIKQAPDSNFMILANYAGTSSSQLIKMSNSGNVMWSTKLNDFVGNTIIKNNNQNFLLSGSGYTSLGVFTPQLFKYSYSGDSIWSATFANNTNKDIYSASIVQQDTNRFYIAVQSEKNSNETYYGIVLEADSLLNVFSADTVEVTKTSNSIWNMVISETSSGGYCLIGTIDSSFVSRTFVKISHRIANSITEQSLKGNDLLIYPNPNKGYFKIDGNFYNNNEIQVKVFDVSGRTISNYEIGMDEKSLTFDCKILRNGVYFIHINVGGQHWVRKVVIAK